MKRPTPTDLELQRMWTASDWLIRLQDAPDDEALVNAWLQWCEQDPQNLEDFQAAQAVWHAAVPAPSAARAQVETLAGQREERGRGDRSESGRATRPAWLRAPALGALAAALVMAVGVGYLTLQGGDDRPSRTYATGIGSTGSTELPDGSRVELGADSRIITFYTADARGVSIESGEAYFNVAKDPSRPFRVTAGDMQVTAVGTAFNVKRHPGRLVVAVSEGQVKRGNSERHQASDNPLAERAPVSLHAGQQAVYSGASGSIEVAAIHVTDVASWRRGVLKYVHEPLGNVVLDLSRYHGKRIVISDTRLSGMPFTGAIFSTRVDDALSALEDSFPLRIREYDDRIELVPRG